LDSSGLTNRYDFDFEVDPSQPAERIVQSIRGQAFQFGLELKPTHEPAEMFVVEKVK
jgi:hypothetical protein